MRKQILIISVLCLIGTAAFAGGGPSGDFRQGLVEDVRDGRIVFCEAGHEETVTFPLGSTVDVEKITLHKKAIITIEDHVVSDVKMMFVPLDTAKVFFILFVGFVGGLVSGFIGSGGAFVLTPGMMSLGVPAAVAVASNMCHKFPKALVGAYKRHKYGQVDLKLGVVVALSAVVGVQVGIRIQEKIFSAWGEAGSNLYVSLAFVFILVTVGGYVFRDAWKLLRTGGEPSVPKLAQKLRKINLPPMIPLRGEDAKISLWFTIPIGFATGLMAATIAVGGFVGVPGMMYVLGVPGLVASATELVVAFGMGLAGSIKWALGGWIDIRLTLLILAASLFGVQLGALGTTYVKDYMIKIVMGSIMLIVAVSRVLAIPGYLADLELMKLTESLQTILSRASFIVMVLALVSGAGIILHSMIKGIRQSRSEG